MTVFFDTTDAEPYAEFASAPMKQPRRARRRKQEKQWNSKMKARGPQQEPEAPIDGKPNPVQRTIDRIRALIDDYDFRQPGDNGFSSEQAWVNYFVQQGAVGKRRTKDKLMAPWERLIVENALAQAQRQQLISWTRVGGNIVFTNHQATLPDSAMFSIDELFQFGKKWRKPQPADELIAA